MKYNKRLVIIILLMIALICIIGAFHYISTLRRLLENQSSNLKNYEKAAFQLLLEQEQFKLFSEKYTHFGTRILTDKDGIIEIGIWAKKPTMNQKYVVQIFLMSKLRDQRLSMKAQLAKDDDPVPNLGNPNISIEIPMEEFEKILSNWLSSENIRNLVNAANEVDWRPIEDFKAFSSKPDINIQYIP